MAEEKNIAKQIEEIEAELATTSSKLSDALERKTNYVSSINSLENMFATKTCRWKETSVKGFHDGIPNSVNVLPRGDTKGSDDCLNGKASYFAVKAQLASVENEIRLYSADHERLSKDLGILLESAEAKAELDPAVRLQKQKDAVEAQKRAEADKKASEELMYQSEKEKAERKNRILVIVLVVSVVVFLGVGYFFGKRQGWF